MRPPIYHPQRHYHLNEREKHQPKHHLKLPNGNTTSIQNPHLSTMAPRPDTNNNINHQHRTSPTCQTRVPIRDDTGSRPTQLLHYPEIWRHRKSNRRPTSLTRQIWIGIQRNRYPHTTTQTSPILGEVQIITLKGLGLAINGY